MTDINEIIGRAMWEQRRRFAAQRDPCCLLEEWGDGTIPASNGVAGEAAAVVKALAEAGYRVVLATEVEPTARECALIGEVAELQTRIEEMEDDALNNSIERSLNGY